MSRSTKAPWIGDSGNRHRFAERHYHKKVRVKVRSLLAAGEETMFPPSRDYKLTDPYDICDYRWLSDNVKVTRK